VDKKEIALAIKRAMAQAVPKKLTANHLADLVGEDRERIKNILAGKILFTPAMIEQYRVALKMPTDWPKEISNPSNPVTYPPIEMPFAGSIPAGQWSDPGESEEFREVEARLFKTNRFCAEIVGESCYPALQPGDFTIWEANRNPKLNKIIIAERYPDHAATVKVLIWDAELKRPALFAINPAFQEPLSEHWDAIAFLVHVSYTDDDGGEITFYREDGIRPEQLIKYRGEK
jgi:SOS-response transcriptional repressor LexA